MADAPRVLFVPVSGAFGMGEYARSLAIAHGVMAEWPQASVHFLLSRAAPYSATVPYAATLLASSPTFHSAAVIRCIDTWRPDVVVFDNAGRTAQLRAAKRRGAAVVYVSARARHRRKAFRLRWMSLIDEHWIAYPEFLAGALSGIERLKLRLIRRPVIRFLDVVLAAAAGLPADARVSTALATAVDYVLLVPGGGTGHPRAAGAVDEFLTAARSVAAASIDCIAVSAAALSPTLPRLQVLGSVAQAELGRLMRGARLIVANGGSTLVQAIASGKPSIAVPIADDQRERIARCVAAGVAVATTLDAPSISRVALALYADQPAREALAGRAMALGLRDGVATAVSGIRALYAARATARQA